MTSSSFEEHDKEAGAAKVEPLSADVNNVLAEGATVKELDVAGSWLAGIAQRPDAAELLAPWTKEEERRMLRWKIDPIIMTLSQFALMMGAVDKVCVGTAAVFGLRSDNNLVGQQYSWVSSIIYFGAILAVIPSLTIMQRVPAGKWLSANVMIWGILLLASAAVKNFTGLMIVRFILGIFESCIFGGFGLIVAMWWKKEEQPWRTAVIFSTLSSVMNGLLSYACANMAPRDHFKQWQLLFILVGIITFLWAIPMWFLLPDSPTTAWWLTDREKVIAVMRTTDNRTGMENKVFKMSQVIETLQDPKTYFYFLINLCLNVPNGGVLTFNSIIVASLGFTTKQTTLLAIPTGVISWISSIVMAYLAVKTGRRFLITILGCLLPFLGVILLYVLPRSNVGGSLAALYLVFFYWGPYTNTAALMYANTGGYTKKGLTYAIAYMGYCVGNIVGPQTFQANQAPKYTSGVAAMLACYAIAMALLAAFWAYCTWLNKKKKAQLAEYEAGRVGKEDLIESWQDQTDFGNPHFQYTT